MSVSFKNNVLLCLEIAFFVISGCAKNKYTTNFKQIIPKITHVEDAIALFGEPDAKMKQGDGKNRRTWIIYKEHIIDAHQKVIYKQSLLGFSELDDYEVMYIPVKSYHTFCNFSLFTDDDDTILSMSWEGNACGYLLQRI